MPVGAPSLHLVTDLLALTADLVGMPSESFQEAAIVAWLEGVQQDRNAGEGSPHTPVMGELARDFRRHVYLHPTMTTFAP